MTLVVNPIRDQNGAGFGATTINLSNHFDDSRTTGLVARFELYNTSVSGGITNVLLFDQPGAGAPLTVQNFVNYVNRNDYANSIIHRSIPGFVIQGGGFRVNGLSNVLAQTPNNATAAITDIPTDPPVQNEFSTGRSNLRGTIAMAKLGGDPNSATSQWFFNLANNSGTPPLGLNFQNGGFTVFGQVLSGSDLNVLDAIAALPRTSNFDPPFTTVIPFGQSVFGEVPLILNNPNSPSITSDDNLVRYRSITVSRVNEFQFSVVGNTNPSLVNATIINNQIRLSYNPSQERTASITVRGTNLLGQTIEDTFSITVNFPTAGADVLAGNSDTDDVILGLEGNDQLTGLGGNDQLSGQRGADTLLGGDGNDTVFGARGNDTIRGGNGNDRIDGGPGINNITTGRGRDTIVLGFGDRTDTVTDFTDDRDKLQLPSGLAFGQVAIFQSGSNTVVQAGGVTLITLQNFNAAALNQLDFV